MKPLLDVCCGIYWGIASFVAFSISIFLHKINVMASLVVSLVGCFCLLLVLIDFRRLLYVDDGKLYAKTLAPLFNRTIIINITEITDVFFVFRVQASTMHWVEFSLSKSKKIVLSDDYYPKSVIEMIEQFNVINPNINYWRADLILNVRSVSRLNMESFK